MSGWINWCLAVLVLGAAESPAAAHAGWAQDAADLNQVRFVSIAAGTVVGDHPPETWSHLVVKSIPRLASGDLDTLPRSAFRTAGLFRTVMLADVGRSAEDSARFVLRRIGVGLSVPIQSRGDVIVRSSRLGELGIALGMMEKVVLRAAEAELAKGRLIACGPTFALYRGPAMMQVGQGHQSVELTYAFLVDEHSGALRVLVWAQQATKSGLLLPAKLVELRPNLVFDCPLSVKADRLLGAIPVSWSFAMENLPPGTPVPLSPSLARYLARDPGTRDTETTEQALRRALARL
jgi:hypothetical protein